MNEKNTTKILRGIFHNAHYRCNRFSCLPCLQLFVISFAMYAYAHTHIYIQKSMLVNSLDTFTVHCHTLQVN